MEDQGDKPDASSIKPVSSLRSQFEQMNKPLSSQSLKPSGGPSRPVSPKPRIQLYSLNSSTNSSVEAITQSTLRPTGANGHTSPHLQATSQPRSRPISVGPGASFPAVTVEPPSSPPKTGTSGQSIPTTPSLLSAEPLPSPTSSSPSSASTRHQRMSSRPQTPLLELRKSPSAPEPPPPRRSGEMRREGTIRHSMGPPPPVNRTDKPMITSRAPSQSPNLVPRTSRLDDRISPFSSPPTSDSSPSPEREALPLPVAKPRPVTMDSGTRSQALGLKFEPPPVHHSVASKRRDIDTVPSRNSSLPQSTYDSPETRPALPTRHAAPITQPVQSRVSAEVHRPNPPSALDPTRSNRIAPPPPRIADNGASFATPPKRIFSTPITQSSTPPRHGRSMTVDQTSDRAPAEFRTPVRTQTNNVQIDGLASSKPTAPASVDHARTTTTQYPDPGQSNRRPPRHKHGQDKIDLRYEARVFDICGDYVCAAGSLTRVWNLKDGEQIFSAAHGEGIRILSVAFKPAANIADEGTRLWLGNNCGEIVEIDVLSHTTIGSKMQAHARHEVIKIYRHKKEMWTLDDVGSLLVWPAGSTGEPNLDEKPLTFRLPKGHSFSMVVDDELWHATGKDLRIFIPGSQAPFQVLQRPIFQEGAGEITCGALLSGQPDRVYIGHNDGKVSIYAKSDYACLGIVNVNGYKINTMAGAGDYLWAGYNTGMVYVYDTTKSPWVVKKDWRAHNNPVINIIRDQASFWTMDRSQILSLGADNVLQVWDGMLEEDWLELEMQSNDAGFCSFEKVKAVVMTWNAGASTPSSLRNDANGANFVRDLLHSGDSPDIVVFGFQELVDLEDKKTTAKSFFKSKKKDPSAQEHMPHQYRDWRNYLQEVIDDSLRNTGEIYHLLHSASLVGLFTCIFVKSDLLKRVKGVCGVEVKRGMGGMHGNKGALIIRFMLADTSVCLVNCHLAAGQTQTKDRNYDISEILESTILPAERDPNVRLDSYTGGGDGTMILDHEICILQGDLNYRIDTMSRDAVVNAVKQGNLVKLLERDQLLASRRKNPAFRLRAFQELPITFAPTYKYDVGTDRYDTSEKRRAPAWCDRILFRCRNAARLRQLDYRRHEVKVSDHRPVTGLFHMTIKTIKPKDRAAMWQDCLQRLAEVKGDWAASSNFDYLTKVCGNNTKYSLKLLDDKQNSRR